MTMISTEPPAERDVSPVRHARLRADAMRRITERKRPGWVVPAIAAAVTALIVAGIAAVPAWRHHDTTAPPARPRPLPGLLAALRDDVGPDNAITGTNVYDPAAGTYRHLGNLPSHADPSPDLRWIGLSTVGPQVGHNQVRIVPPAQSDDADAGVVDPASVAPWWTPSASRSLWSADSSRYYLGIRTTTGVRMLGIDPARHAVVSTTGLAVPHADVNAAIVAADPHDGFWLLGRSGLLYAFDPAGRPTGSRQVARPVPDSESGTVQALLSPDHTRVLVSDRDGIRTVDLRTGAQVHAATRGAILEWLDAGNYVTTSGVSPAIDVDVVAADSGRVVASTHLTAVQAEALVQGRLIPFTGTPPPGAVTITF